MNAVQLLNLATNQAISQSKKEFANQKTYLLFDGKSEYTVAGEKGLSMVQKVEPNLTIIATYFNGEKVD